MAGELDGGTATGTIGGNSGATIPTGGMMAPGMPPGDVVGGTGVRGAVARTTHNSTEPLNWTTSPLSTTAALQIAVPVESAEAHCTSRMPLRGPATLVIGMRRTGMSAGSRLPICPCTVKPVVVVRFRQFIATVHGPELISPVATSRRPMLSMSRPGPGTNTTWQMAPLLAQGRVGGVGVALGLGTMVAVAVAPGV